MLKEVCNNFKCELGWNGNESRGQLHGVSPQDAASEAIGSWQPF